MKSNVDNPSESINIGDGVIGGTANSVLFIDASGNIAQDNPGFTYVVGTGLSLDDSVVIIGSLTAGDLTVSNGIDLNASDIIDGGNAVFAGSVDAFDILADNYFDQGGNTQWGSTDGSGNFSFSGNIFVPGTGRFDTGLIDSLGNTSVDIEGHTLASTAGSTVVDYDNLQLSDAFGSVTVDWENEQLSVGGNITVDWGNLTLNDSSAGTSLDWSNRILIASDGSDTILDWSTAGTAQFGDSLITTARAGVPLDIQNTTDGTNQVAIFRGGNRAIPADGQNAFLSFFLDDSTGTQVEFARMGWFAGDVTNTVKDGEFRFSVMNNNTLRNMLTIKENTVAINEDSQDANFRVESNNQTSLLFTDGGLDTVTIGSATSLALLGVDGFADEIQFLVQAHSTQTSDLVVFEQSDGTDIFTVSNAGAVTMAASLDVPEIFNSAGDLKVMPDVQGDVTLFEDTDIDNAANGKRIIIHRKAAEFDRFFDIFIDNLGSAQLDMQDGNGSLNIGQNAGAVNILGNANGNFALFTASGSGENRQIRQGGFITGTGVQDIFWTVKDTDDFFHLEKEAGILGFKINMPTVIADRLLGQKGSDVASATDITLGAGNYFDITGTTQIDTIVATDWTAGSVVTLQFDASVTVKHNTAGVGAVMLLAGAVDFSATANDTLMFVFDGTNFRELARTAI
ncbi:hypothetical protein LCGC14_0418150 [marine sediment metagenome]|uniref:Uncharacterized protein n=1 Tax=marine sediment metagenome TaxID=412755 RepID=A0A0F9SXT2_9ZZZZ